MNHWFAFSAGPALLLYAVSCTLPALRLWNTGTNSLDVLSGGRALSVGWLVFFTGQLSWLANPLFFGGLVALWLDWPRLAAALAIAGALACAHVFALHGRPLPANEAGEGELHLRSVGPGYWLWVASMVALAGAAIFRAAAGPGGR
jgi:hypothetical protein